MKLKTAFITTSAFLFTLSLHAQVIGAEFGAEDSFYNSPERERLIDSDYYDEAGKKTQNTVTQEKMPGGKERSKDYFLDVFFKYQMNNLWLVAGAKSRRSRVEMENRSFLPITPDMNYKDDLLVPTMDVTSTSIDHTRTDGRYYLGLETEGRKGLRFKIGHRNFEDESTYSWSTMLYGPFSFIPQGANYIKTVSESYSVIGNSGGEYYASGFYIDFFKNFLRLNYEYTSSPHLRGTAVSTRSNMLDLYSMDQPDVFLLVNTSQISFSRMNLSANSHSLDFEFFPHSIVSLKIGVTAEELRQSYPGHAALLNMSMMYFTGSNLKMDINLIKDRPEFITDYLIYAKKNTTQNGRAYAALNVKYNFDDRK